jgi:hypothetical protein
MNMQLQDIFNDEIQGVLLKSLVVIHVIVKLSVLIWGKKLADMVIEANNTHWRRNYLPADEIYLFMEAVTGELPKHKNITISITSRIYQIVIVVTFFYCVINLIAIPIYTNGIH